MIRKIADILPHIKLRPHQEEAVKILDKNDGSMLLNWRVGTGKTLGSIALVEKLKEKGKSNAALIVTPAPLKHNYLNEGIKKFTNSSGVLINSKGKKEKRDEAPIEKIKPGKDYYIVSNEMFRKYPEEVLRKTQADSIVIDEIHKYKDPTSQNYRALMSVRNRLNNVIGLTGTPINNHPKDIIPILDVITNKQHRLGTPAEFNKKFLEKKKIKKGPLSFLGIGKEETLVRVKNPNLLRSQFQKYVHSQQGDTKDMPIKKIIEIDIPMSKDQKIVYDYALNKNIPKSVREKIEKNMPVSKREASFIFTAILNARQASNALHPFNTSMSLEESARSTPKMQRVLDDVQEHLKKKNNKAIIYTNLYQGGVDAVSAGLNERKIDHGVYVGTKNSPVEQRNKSVKDYLDGKKRVMVLNQAATEGVNLPGTTAHFALDGHFNPAVIEQSEARGIRSGSPVKEVEVRRYKSVLPQTNLQKIISKLPILKGTSMAKSYSTDEWVYSVAKKKKEVNDLVMDVLNQKK